MPTKKILFLHQGTFWNRGSEKVLLCLLNNINRDHFTPLLVCNHKLLAAEARKNGIETIQSDWPEIIIDDRISLQFIGVLKKIFWLKSLIKKESVDLVVCHSGMTTQSGLFAAQLTNIPAVSYIHCPYTKRYIYLYRLHKAHLAIFVSKAIKTAMNKKVAFTNTQVIHNGIDTEYFSPVTVRDRQLIQNLQIDTTATIIGQIGSLIHRKGIDLLIEAAKQLIQRNNRIHLVIVGGGPQEAELKAMIKDYDLTAYFSFAGDSETPDLFYKHIFDINVLASRSEAFGLTLAEGAACGLPCIGSNTEGIPEVMHDNKTGFLFESGNADDLANKLELLIQNRDLREEMGQKGREFVVDNLSVKKQTTAFNETLLGLTSN